MRRASPIARITGVGTMVVTLLGAMAITTLSSPVSQAAPATTSYQGTMESAQYVGTTSVSSLATSSSTTTGKPVVIPMHPRPGSGTHPGNVVPPNVNSTSVASGTLLHNFSGVDAIQNGHTINTDVEPPDEAVAANGTYVINFVNLTGAIYTLNGTLVKGPFALGYFGGPSGGFFHVAANSLPSDPRLFYDAATHTWFATVLEMDNYFTSTPGPGYIDLAVNSGNPVTSAWKVYKVRADDKTLSGCPCLPDYPILGVDAYNVYLVPNEFQLYGPGFNGSDIFALAKSQLIAGVASPHVAHYAELSMAGAPVYHLEPANEYTSASVEYFMNSLDPNSIADNRLGVWALANPASVATGNVPSLSSTVITSESYVFPVNAQTPPGYCSGCGAPTTGVVQSDFDALEQLQYVNGHLYSSLNTAVTINGDTGERDGIAWFNVVPTLNNGAITSGTHIAAQGYLATRGEYLMYPDIEVTTSGTAAIVTTYGGPGTYLSAGYFVGNTTGNYGGLHTAGAGVDPDNGFTGTSAYGGAGRWGDYSAGQLAPSGGGIWLATQYIPNNGDQYANWGNRIFEIAG